MMAIKILGRHRDQAGTVCQAPLATGQRPRRRGAAIGPTESARLGTMSRAGAVVDRKLQPDELRNWGFRAWCVTVKPLFAADDALMAILVKLAPAASAEPPELIEPPSSSRSGKRAPALAA